MKSNRIVWTLVCTYQHHALTQKWKIHNIALHHLVTNHNILICQMQCFIFLSFFPQNTKFKEIIFLFFFVSLTKLQEITQIYIIIFTLLILGGHCNGESATHHRLSSDNAISRPLHIWLITPSWLQTHRFISFFSTIKKKSHWEDETDHLCVQHCVNYCWKESYSLGIGYDLPAEVKRPK